MVLPADQPRPRSRLRRKQYVINKPFQYRFIGIMNAVAFAIIGVVYAANRAFIWRLRAPMEKQLPPDHLFFRFMDSQAALLNKIFLGTAVLIVLGLSIFGLLFSHRIAGPIYKLTKHMLEIAKGAPIRPVRYRKGDFFQESAAAFNELGGRLAADGNSPPK